MPATIQLFPARRVENVVFSIIIPSWNNLSFLKKCIDSIVNYSTYKHQIIVHVNEGTDGTLKWVESLGIDYSWSIRNAGMCFPVNACRSMLQTDYIVFMNDDMFVCPRWDETLLNEIKTLNTHLFHISATVIEPRVSANHTAIAPYNYGETLATFQESKLLAEYADIKHVNWNGASWAPFVIHKTTWDLVGGFSIDFSPGIFAQHDLSMKLYRSGVRIFKGVSESRVYHFMSKSTAKVKKNNGKRQFLFKWGISAHAFYKEYLKMGDSYAPLPELIEGSRISRTRRFARFTQMVILLMNERR